MDFRQLPAARVRLVDENGRTSVEFYQWFSSLRIPNIEDGRVVFSNQGVFAGAIVGVGLTLNRITNTLSATGEPFPEAPQDGAIYGRRNAAWTQVVASGIAGAPGPPQYSIQYNDPLGFFNGDADFLFDQAGKYVRLGTVIGSPYTIAPVVQTLPDTIGVNLTVEAGTALGNGQGGQMIVRGGQSGATGLQGGTMSVRGGIGIGGAGGNVEVVSGNGSGANTSGEVSVFSNTPTGSGATGQVFLYSGTITNAASVNQTGNVTIRTGGQANTSVSASGAVLMETGNAANSGDITIRTGTGTVTTGDINISTGVTAGVRGDVNITATTVTVNGQTVGAGVPYFIASTATFTINDFFQATFALPIEVEGTLNVDGYLIEVD